MKTIKCNCGKDILMDDDEELYKRALSLSWNCDSGRASVRHTYTGGSILTFAEMVLGEKKEELIDHHDLNTHNNQKDNLRHATKQQNAFNRHVRKGSFTEYKGVAVDPGCKLLYRAYIQLPNKTKKTLGRFATAEEAARAYNAAAIIIHGEFACLNNV